MANMATKILDFGRKCPQMDLSAAIMGQKIKILKIPTPLFSDLTRGCSITIFSLPSSVVVPKLKILGENWTFLA